ncbi:MAG TPA: trehalose-phosphatase, partial [Erythrobacter sp.]|nr:trehalose-phosphatase [Erythrobacter sp.]
EDGFAGAGEHGGFGIAVGERPSRQARYGLDSVAAVHHWLEI